MIEILFYSYLISIQIYICGYIFFYVIIDKKVLDKSNIYELFFYGTFILSFIAIFLNFFTSLNPIINSILFFIPFVVFTFLINKKFFIYVLKSAIPISILFCLTISYDGTYRPDAGSYHLPYISILNENKILIGINNIHYRFGHTSIIQYLSAIYNNLIFNEKGITIPLGLIYCNFIGYCIHEVFNKKNNNIIKIFIFLLLSFVLFRVNRYSDFGNDAPANIFFFYLIIEAIKGEYSSIKIKKTIFASTFVFLNKITLLIGFLIPLVFIFQKFEIKKIFNRISIISIIFIIFFFGKNILISGCVIFPIEQTCLSNLYWYDTDSDRNSNAKIARVENEAWTKGWVNQDGNKKIYSEYLKDFIWIETWVNSEGKKIVKKVLPYFIFISIFYIFILTLRRSNAEHKTKKIKAGSEYYLCLFICFIGSLLWFLKFPVFRYGYGYLISLIALILIINLNNSKLLLNNIKLEKSFKYLIILLLIGVTSKNLNRIIKGYNAKNNLWPNIYDSGNEFKKRENFRVIKNNKLIFYKSKKGECYYSSSPCTHFFNGNDFTLDELNIKNLRSYKVYYFKK